MSARRVAETGFSLPANPSYIDFPRTDGGVSTWPPNITRVVDSEGHVNFYAHVDLDHHQNMKWRTTVGDAISLKLKMPEGPSYVLRNFPDGYRLFDHHKGPASAPRHDLYLFGPLKKRFRSINEFIPHAIWLMGDPSVDCECKYCAKKAQREVTASISNILRTTPTKSPASPKTKPLKEKGKARDPASRLRDARKRDNRIYAAVQRTIEPLKPSPHVLKQPMLVERSNDLRGVFSKASVHVPRWFREGEVVWCALNQPIYAMEPNVAIEYWPAVVDEVLLKSQPIPRNSHTNDANSHSPPGTPQASTSTIRPKIAHESEKGPMLEPSTEPLPWTIQQTMRYKVHFLAVSHSMTFDNADVLPYQAYMPSDEVIQVLTSFPAERLSFDKDSLSKFNPCPADKIPSIDEAIPAYAVALQIASSVSSYWCLTDDYELKCWIPPSSQTTSLPSSAPTAPPHQSSSKLPPPQQSLHEAIQASSLQNISHKQYESISTVHAESSKSAQNTIYHVPGMPLPPDQLAQTRFQGLWWGAERIWVDDFIRLKIPRRSLAPDGGDHILPAAGPGETCLKTSWLDSSRDIEELGAGMRGVFLRLEGLLAVDVPADNATGTKKEARICGTLYELADEDWIDPNEQPTTNGVTVNSTDTQQPPIASTSNSQPASQINVAPPKMTAVTANNRPNSGPPLGMYLPRAPHGYKFRPILEPGYEFVGAMGLIGGRYYPRVLTHPRVLPTVYNALEESALMASNNLWALEGLSGGYFNTIDPCRYKKSRMIMLQDADKEAMSQLKTYQQGRLAEKRDVFGPDQAIEVVKDANAMDVDDIY